MEFYFLPFSVHAQTNVIYLMSHPPSNTYTERHKNNKMDVRTSCYEYTWQTDPAEWRAGCVGWWHDSGQKNQKHTMNV